MRNYTYSSVLKELNKPITKVGNGFVVDENNMKALVALHTSRYVDATEGTLLINQAQHVLGESRYKKLAQRVFNDTYYLISTRGGIDATISAFSMKVKNGRTKKRK